MSRKKIIIQTIIFIAATAGLVYLVSSKWGEISTGLAKISILSLLLISLLQGLSYFTRIRAWKMSLKRTKTDIPEGVLQSSSGATFLLNCFVPMYVGQWARVFILRKFSSNPPKISQMATAEGANLFVEAVIILLILIATIPFLPFGLFPLIGIFLVVAISFSLALFFVKKHPEKEWVKALYIFKDRKDLTLFSLLLLVVILIQPVRFFIVFDAIGNPETIITSALAFIATCISGILPFGPTASATGGVAAASGETLAFALTIGIVLAASAALAALLYFAFASLFHFFEEKRRLSSRSIKWARFW